MPDLRLTFKFRWLGAVTHKKQAILKRAKQIDTLKNHDRLAEALTAEHEAIEVALQSLEAAVTSGATRAEVVDVMNVVIAFCTVHFADEESLMRSSGYRRLSAHVAAHKRLLAKFVTARHSAACEDISLATLDHLDLLHAFHNHVTVWDRRMATGLTAAGKSVAHGSST